MRRRPSLASGIVLVLGTALLLSATLLVPPGCGEDENCQPYGGNCRSAYLESNGLSGCCAGLSCQESTIDPTQLVCR